LNICVITPSFYPAVYWGGPIYSTKGLCQALAVNKGIVLRVLTTDTSGPTSNDRLIIEDLPEGFPSNFLVYYCKKSFGKDVSLEFFVKLIPMVKWADVIYLNGVYSPPTIPVLIACRLLKRPVIWATRGALQRWEGSTNRSIKVVWEYICRTIIHPSRTVLHVTSQEEADAAKSRMPNVPLSVIQNGVEIPEVEKDRKWIPQGCIRLLYLGRLHPIKGLENLIGSLTLPGAKNAKLTLAGDGDSRYRDKLEKLVLDNKLDRRVSFLGHVSGDEKHNLFLNSDVCIMPSYTENFGMVVAEALAHGLPVIASKGTPWSRVVGEGCGLWVENSPEALSKAIGSMELANLKEMGEKGRKWMMRDYSWSGVSGELLAVCEGLLNQ